MRDETAREENNRHFWGNMENGIPYLIKHNISEK
jgi:hypothetical protein